MKKYYATVLIIFFLALATAVLAAPPVEQSTPRDPARLSQPQGPQYVHGPWAQGKGERHWSYLKFSKEQKEKMRELRNRFVDETHSLRYDVAMKRLEMRKLFTDPAAGDAAILAKAGELSSLRQKLLDKRMQMAVEWRKLLTPDQIRKLDRMPMAGKGRHFGMM